MHERRIGDAVVLDQRIGGKTRALERFGHVRQKNVMASNGDNIRFFRRNDVSDRGQVGILGEQRVVDQFKSGALEQVRSEEHTSELQSLMRISYAVFCLKKKIYHTHTHYYK